MSFAYLSAPEVFHDVETEECTAKVHSSEDDLSDETVRDAHRLEYCSSILSRSSMSKIRGNGKGRREMNGNSTPEISLVEPFARNEAEGYSNVE